MKPKLKNPVIRSWEVAELITALKMLPTLLFSLDKSGRVEKVYSRGQPNFRNLLVGSLVPGSSLSELIGEESARKLYRAHIEALRYQSSRSITFFSPGTEGENRQYRARIVPVVSPGDTSSRTMVVIEDVTLQKVSHDQRLLMEKIVSSSIEPMIVFGTYGDTFFNGAFLHLFGMKHKEAKMLRNIENLSPFFTDKQYAKILKLKDLHGSFQGEVSIFRPDRKKIDVWMKLENIQDGKTRDESFQIALFLNKPDQNDPKDTLHFTAMLDSLTGLSNRRKLLEDLDRAIKKGLRYQHSGAVFFMDLDNFKQINDTLGHAAGDEVLVECTSRIRSVLRETDTLGRLGGDEFLLIVEIIESPDDLMHLAQKIISVVNRPFHIGDLKYNIGMSIGVAIFPEDSTDKSQLLQFADMAMYQAKEEGKNRYRFYSGNLDRVVKRHFLIEKTLHHALEHNGFYLAFQPKVDLNTNLMTGMEVLLRIDEKISGSIHPAEFIPIAEESDLILKIGRWVFTRCCQIIYLWKREYVIDHLEFSVNLSRRQLMEESLVDFIKYTIEKYRLDPKKIEFEITETSMMHSQETAALTIRRLKELGCRISIDDFGTGYSSLATLQKFTVDKLKIDKSFIKNLSTSSVDRSIVKAAIAMANALGLHTIAEGVETEEQKKLIQLMGCKEIQGYLYSKPKSATEMLKVIQRTCKRR